MVSVVEYHMVFYTPPLQRLPSPVSPPATDKRVAGVERIGAWKKGDPEDRQRRGAGDPRSLRQRLLDLVMEEVETLPDLSVPQKQRIRDNLERHADRQGGRYAAAPPEPPGPAGSAATDRPVPPPVIGLEAVLGAMGDGDPAASELPADDLSTQMRQLLSLHTVAAAKIAAYLHALETTAPEAHGVDLDI